MFTVIGLNAAKTRTSDRQWFKTYDEAAAYAKEKVNKAYAEGKKIKRFVVGVAGVVEADIATLRNAKPADFPSLDDEGDMGCACY